MARGGKNHQNKNYGGICAIAPEPPIAQRARALVFGDLQLECAQQALGHDPCRRHGKNKQLCPPCAKAVMIAAKRLAKAYQDGWAAAKRHERAKIEKES